MGCSMEREKQKDMSRNNESQGWNNSSAVSVHRVIAVQQHGSSFEGKSALL